MIPILFEEHYRCIGEEMSCKADSFIEEQIEYINKTLEEQIQDINFQLGARCASDQLAELMSFAREQRKKKKKK